jgi:hypothetical protein
VRPHGTITNPASDAKEKTHSATPDRTIPCANNREAIPLRPFNPDMPARTTALAILLSIASPLLAADKETVRIDHAISPDKTLHLSATGNEAGCEITLAEASDGRVLLKFPVDGLRAGSVGEYFTAVWKSDSTAVALNARCGRSITKCLAVCLAEGNWQNVVFPEDRLAALRKRNTIEDDKAQDYFEASAWRTPDLLETTYQGNVGIVNHLTFRLVTKNPPRFTLIKETAEQN